MFNLVFEKDGFLYYSFVREDGFNMQEYARRKAERYRTYSENAQARSERAYNSREGLDFLALGEPIKIGHHSERAHRNLIERNDRKMRKCVQEGEKAEIYEQKADSWEDRTEDINLSMPESLEYFEKKLAEAKEWHEGLKSGSIPRGHGYSLTYAKKTVNELTKKVEIAKKLWGD